MNLKLVTLFAVAWLGAAGAAKADDKAIREALAQAAPGFSVQSISKSPIAGVFEVVGSQGAVLYVSADGSHLLQGDLYHLPTQTNVTEKARTSVRAEQLKSLKPAQRIVFAANGETKHKVLVFTDIDCGYCRVLHSKVSEYTALGIEIDYVFFPRSGPGTPSWDKAVSVWCADNQQDAMTRAKAGEEPEPRTCESPIQQTYELAARLGVTGTPSVVLPDGQMLPGYVPPDQMIERLDAAKAAR